MILKMPLELSLELLNLSKKIIPSVFPQTLDITINGADEGTRTPTPLALVPKTSASASSATSA